MNIYGMNLQFQYFVRLRGEAVRLIRKKKKNNQPKKACHVTKKQHSIKHSAENLKLHLTVETPSKTVKQVHY